MEKQIYVCMLGSDLAVHGGMSAVVSQLLHHRWSQGLQIEYIPTHASGSALRRGLVFLRGYFHLRGLLKQGRADLVHLHMSQRGSFCRKYILHRLVKRYGGRDILHLHGSEFMAYYAGSSEKVKRRIRALLRECDRVLVLGKNWQHNVRDIEPRANICVLRNAVMIPQGAAKWDESQTELCYLGVLIPRKGVADLLHALKLLQQQGLERPVHLTVAGTGEAEQYLQQLSRELGLEEQVRFTGWVDGEEKRKLLLSSQCFVLPSYNEGLPVCVLEAISCAVPTVSTNVGSVDEAIRDGENGRLVQPGDPQALAEAIRWVTSDRERWEVLSSSAKQTARDSFDERFIFAQLEELYFDLTGEDVL